VSTYILILRYLACVKNTSPFPPVRRIKICLRTAEMWRCGVRHSRITEKSIEIIYIIQCTLFKYRTLCTVQFVFLSNGADIKTNVEDLSWILLNLWSLVFLWSEINVSCQKRPKRQMTCMLFSLYVYTANCLHAGAGREKFTMIRIPYTVLLHSQRWASFPPEVTVKSLPLLTNLKIVTVTLFSLPAWKNFETVTSFSLPAPQKIWNG
jgi:hypothetical protein